MYFLNVPPISLLDDRDPPSKILKEPRGLYASKVADLMTSWQTIPRWPAESQVRLFSDFVTGPQLAWILDRQDLCATGVELLLLQRSFL